MNRLRTHSSHRADAISMIATSATSARKAEAVCLPGTSDAYDPTPGAKRFASLLLQEGPA